MAKSVSITSDFGVTAQFYGEGATDEEQEVQALEAAKQYLADETDKRKKDSKKKPT